MMGTAGLRAPQRSGPWGKFLVLGASSHPDAVRRQEGARHAQAIIGLVDADRGSYRQLFAYESAVSLRPPEGAMRFGAGCIDGGLLWTCTPTEVVAFELAGLRQVCSLSLPWFNDLHHVVRYRDGVLVAATGVDRVIHCDLAGGVRRVWHVLEGEGAVAPPDGRDYRMVVSTKPHLSHPNYVFVVDDAVWATRFEQRDAVCLTDSYRVLSLGGERPHDGHVSGDDVTFTTVDGHVVIANIRSGRVRRFDLQAMSGETASLGWCRGLAMPSCGLAVVGFSRLRPTRLRENLRWLKYRFGMRSNPGNLPARVAGFDLDAGTMAFAVEVECHGLNAIFDVLPWPDSANTDGREVFGEAGPPDPNLRAGGVGGNPRRGSDARS